MQGMNEGDDESSAEEDKHKALIEKHKARYKDNFSKLRELKAEIENIQQHMEKQRKVLQKDFEDWYNLMVRQVMSPVETACREAEKERERDPPEAALNPKP